MRKNIFLCILFGLLFASCYEDKGNYDYLGFPNLEMKLFEVVTDSETGEEVEREFGYIRVKSGDVVKIRPHLENNTEDNYSNLEYKWIYKDQVISTEKTLVWETSEVGEGSVVLEVNDPTYGTRFISSFSIHIESAYNSSGFLILDEKDGKKRLSFLMGGYYYDTKEFSPRISLYSEENDGKELPGGAFKIHMHFRRADENSQIMVVAPDDLVDINAYTFKEAMRGEDMFRGQIPEISDVMFMQWVDLAADTQGRLYRRIKSTNELFHSNQFLDTPLTDENGEEYRGIRFIPGNLSKSFGLMLDTEKNRYLAVSDYRNYNGSKHTLGKIMPIVYNDNGETEWPEGYTPLDNMGDAEVLFTGHYFYPSIDVYLYRTTQYFSVIRKGGKYYYQYFQVHLSDDASSAYVTDFLESEFKGLEPLMDENTHFELMRQAQGYDYSRMQPYLLIAKGNELHLFDINRVGDEKPSGTTVKLFEFPSPIVAMDGQSPLGSQLGVGLEDGSFYVLNMPGAKNMAMDEEKLVIQKLPVGTFGQFTDVLYNIMEQAPSLY
ncbi:PKD-like family lipoprotein [Bacteroides xylanisolvens]|uniref:PKD-like family lipoprotein n=1 Tax=Bacteroides xylanisolvens TaxID=371601 RepID=UPI002307C2F7|nr:PKD-like family lipoprotein [Bacteroides xylanisolvens]MDB0714765.1 PKD-like family lipoprotein [Bacteroides xylanisolvens]MDB0734453.1 PKD-like family lipoprotein [Bacteroides xylanisolvens]